MNLFDHTVLLIYRPAFWWHTFHHTFIYLRTQHFYSWYWPKISKTTGPPKNKQKNSMHSGVFLNGSLFPLTLPETQAKGKRNYFEPGLSPGGKTHKSVVCPPWLPHSWVFKHSDLSSLFLQKLQFQVFLPLHRFLQQFPLMSFCSSNHDSLYSPVCPILGAVVCPGSSPLIWI